MVLKGQGFQDKHLEDLLQNLYAEKWRSWHLRHCQKYAWILVRQSYTFGKVASLISQRQING